MEQRSIAPLAGPSSRDVGAVTAWGSCKWYGANFFDGLEADRRTKMPVPLAVGTMHNIRGDEEASISRERLDVSEVMMVHGMPCTRGRRALSTRAGCD